MTIIDFSDGIYRDHPLFGWISCGSPPTGHIPVVLLMMLYTIEGNLQRVAFVEENGREGAVAKDL